MNPTILSESVQVDRDALQPAVAEYVADMFGEDADPLYHSGTMKHLFGESLSHDEIMLNIPKVRMSDVVVFEAYGGVGDSPIAMSSGTSYQLSPTAFIKRMITKLKLGKTGLVRLHNLYKDIRKRYPRATFEFVAAKAASAYGGLDSREAIKLLRKLEADGGVSEAYIKLAEDVPTNVAGGTMPSHAPTDGKKSILGKDKKKKPVKRKQVSEMKSFKQLQSELNEQFKKKDPQDEPPGEDANKSDNKKPTDKKDDDKDGDKE